MSVEVDSELIVANTPCQICGSAQSTSFFDTRFRKFKHSSTFHMRKCDTCDLLFCSPRLDDAGIAALYDSNYYVFKKTDEAYYQRTVEIYSRTIAQIARPDPLAAIEIGSGKGYLLAVLKRLGWDVFGVEISSHAADYAKQHFGVASFTGTLDDYLEKEKNPATWPVVLCIDIIEHVTDPDKFVGGLARITSRGGSVIIDTPNGAAAHIAREGAGWRGFNPFHIFLFNEHNLSRLLLRHGLRTTKVFTYNNILDREAASRSRVSGFLDRFLSAGPAKTFEQCVTQSAKSKATDFAGSRGELAAERRGENLVIIAEKI